MSCLRKDKNHVTRHIGRDAFLPKEPPTLRGQINSRFPEFILSLIISWSICRYLLRFILALFLVIPAILVPVATLVSRRGSCAVYPPFVLRPPRRFPGRKQFLRRYLGYDFRLPFVHTYPVTPRASPSPVRLYIHIICTNEATSGEALLGLRPMRGAAVPWRAGCAVASKHHEGEFSRCATDGILDSYEASEKK